MELTPDEIELVCLFRELKVARQKIINSIEQVSKVNVWWSPFPLPCEKNPDAVPSETDYTGPGKKE